LALVIISGPVFLDTAPDEIVEKKKNITKNRMVGISRLIIFLLYSRAARTIKGSCYRIGDDILSFRDWFFRLSPIGVETCMETN
jgi:hypothetical protein